MITTAVTHAGTPKESLSPLEMGICLGHISDAERSKETEYGEKHSQPFAVKPSLYVDHGAADPVAALIAVAVFNTQRILCIVGHHAQKSRQPHPEYRSRTAKGNGGGHTCDVAGAYGSRQRRTQGLKL